MTITLNQAVHQNSDDLFFLQRAYRSTRSVIEHKEWSLLGAYSLCGTIAIAYSVAFSVFCMQGVARSYEEVSARNGTLVGLRPLGDAGGWTMLMLFAALTVENIVTKLVREGEYLKLQSVCQQWIDDNKNQIQSSPSLHQKLYRDLNQLLDSHNAQCLFSKKLISRRLLALEIYKKSGLADQGAELIEDRKLEANFSQIKVKIEEKTSCSHYFRRLWKGVKVVRRGGYFETLGSLFKGVVLPISFTAMSVLSYVGEYGLGLDLYDEHNNPTDVGHFGEWPFNVIEAMGVALFLHRWCMLNEGDFVITRKIYDKVLQALNGDTQAHNRMCQLANEDLAQQSINCQYMKLPLDYQFEEI